MWMRDAQLHWLFAACSERLYLTNTHAWITSLFLFPSRQKMDVSNCGLQCNLIFVKYLNRMKIISFFFYFIRWLSWFLHPPSLASCALAAKRIHLIYIHSYFNQMVCTSFEWNIIITLSENARIFFCLLNFEIPVFSPKKHERRKSSFGCHSKWMVIGKRWMARRILFQNSKIIIIKLHINRKANSIVLVYCRNFTHFMNYWQTLWYQI